MHDPRPGIEPASQAQEARGAALEEQCRRAEGRAEALADEAADLRAEVGGVIGPVLDQYLTSI
jgi:hypothetical protein